MKKLQFRILAGVMAFVLLAALAGCGQAEAPATNPPGSSAPSAGTSEPPAESAAPAFEPASNGEWVVNYNAGSGADTFTRQVINAITENKLTTANLPVVNKPEGSGVVAIQYVIDLNNKSQIDNTLITLGGGDLTEGADLAGIDVNGIQPLAVMAAEVPMLVRGKNCKYENFAAAVEAMKNGTQVIFGGPQNDYELMANELRDELGLTDAVFTYIPYSSGGEGITSLLGGHIDFALATASHVGDNFNSGDVIAEWLFSDGHFQFGNLTELPTLSEYTNGEHNNIVWEIYRIVAASSKMSPEAVDYWVNVLEEVTKTDAWANYCSTFSLMTKFMPKDEALPLM